MSELQVGAEAPDFTLATDTAGDINLSDYKGQKVILFFYPKDDTPGCTIESNEFSDLNDKFKAKNCVVIGVSPDNVASHAKFRNKYGLNVLLASDESHDILSTYGVWQQKKNFGKEYMGIVRTTYLIDETGVIAQIWNKVKVKDHVQIVLDSLSA
uniref:thioredoxin-dependent peroxiredoxin n=1 Tax=OCS116 cluster bacterium TaxID=2030921 RepID=A0A2A4YVR0_9PROT